MSRPLRVLFVYTARKKGLLAAAARGEQPDTLLFGLNHLAAHGIEAEFYEPEYGPLGRSVASQAGRLGPDALQLRTLTQFPAYDVVFLTGGWPLLLAARVLEKRRRPKLVWLNMTLTNRLRRGGPLALLIQRAIRQADLVVCVARAQQRFLAERVGLPMVRLPLALSGTDAGFYDPARASPARPGGAGARGYVLAAGRDAGRDYATLLEAVRGDQRHLRLVCSARNLAGLALPANAQVRFDIGPAELRDEYAGAAAVAVPTYGDSSTAGSDCSGTLVLLDALAMGRPSVISARASVHDYAIPGHHTLCVPPRDPQALRAALDRLLGDPDCARQLGAEGQEHVRQRLTTRHFAARLAELFHHAVAR